MNQLSNFYNNTYLSDDFSVLNLNKLNFCSFNTNGAKRNINFIEFLMKKNDFIFYV